MQQKLDAVRAEADRARRRSQALKEKAAATAPEAGPEHALPAKRSMVDAAPKRGQVATTKRTAIPKRIGGRAKRRSTLSPAELEGLMAR